MDWILNHTHLPGLDTVQTIGAAATMWVGVVIGKQIIRIVGGAINTLIANANRKDK
jgi:hypothetical protein